MWVRDMVAHRCRVGLDFDGLLFEFYALILAWRYNLKFEDALYIVRDSGPSPLREKSWGGTAEQAGALVTQFYRELNFSKIELVDGAEDMIQTLAQNMTCIWSHPTPTSRPIRSG